MKLFVTVIRLFRAANSNESLSSRHFKWNLILFMVWMSWRISLWKWILSLGLTNAMFGLISGFDTFLITDGQIDTKNGVTLVSRKNFNWVTIARPGLSLRGYDLWLMIRSILQNLAQIELMHRKTHFALYFTKNLNKEIYRIWCK